MVGFGEPVGIEYSSFLPLHMLDGKLSFSAMTVNLFMINSPENNFMVTFCIAIGRVPATLNEIHVAGLWLFSILFFAECLSTFFGKP